MRALFIALIVVVTVPATAMADAGAPVVGTPPIKHEVRDRFGRTLIYYANRTATPTPILLMIQGSGCETVIGGEGGTNYSTMYDLPPFANVGRLS